MKKIKMEHLREYTGSRSKTVLDIGCIGGTLKKITNSQIHGFLVQEFNSVVGIDLDERSVKLLRKRGFNIKKADAQNFNLNKKFDIIFCGNIIEHLADLSGFMKSIKRHSKKDTKIIIWTGNAYSLINFLGILFKGKRRICEEHCIWNSLETLTSLSERYGFEVTRHKFFNIPPNGTLINRIVLSILGVIQIIRPAFSDGVLVELEVKQ